MAKFTNKDIVRMGALLEELGETNDRPLAASSSYQDIFSTNAFSGDAWSPIRSAVIRASKSQAMDNDLNAKALNAIADAKCALLNIAKADLGMKGLDEESVRKVLCEEIKGLREAYKEAQPS